MAKFSFNHILVPYDGTQSSKIAFQAGLKIAKDNKSEFSVITCIEEKTTLGFFQTKSDKKEYQRIKNEATKHHEKLKKEAQDSQIDNLKFKIMKSDLASDCIVRYAKENKVTTIIMNKTKLHTQLEKRYYNSTVENVFKKAPCSVLVIK